MGPGRWTALLMLMACARDPRRSEVPARPRPSPPPAIDAGVTQVAPGWQRVELADAKIAVDLLAEPAIDRTEWHPGAALQQGAPNLRLVVRAGQDETLESWRQFDVMSPEWTLAPPRALTVCGQPASMQVAEAPDWHGEVKDRSGYHMASLPARTQIVLAFARGALGVTLRWEVDTDHRAALTSAERHFFTSVLCR